MKADGVCMPCRTKKSDALITVVEQWWAEGVPVDEIAQRLGKSRGWVGGMMNFWRSKGANLPYRKAS